MRLGRMITAVDAHAGGEPGRVITGGVGDVPGATMFEKMQYLHEHHDDLRRLMLREPRGYPAANCNLVLPPAHPEADAGFVIMEQVEYPAMSGTNTICVTTVLLETGMVAVTEPVTDAHARGARRPDRVRADVPRRQGHAGHLPQRAGLRRAPRRADRGPDARHGDGRTSPGAACSTSSPTRASSACA